mmetsp:Transcript_114948/g.199246  ORF Transcript_114948/g.199246 Transcript_114948/m.199246 type:complete len:610 (+) Transcript_114948:58-1887(+)
MLPALLGAAGVKFSGPRHSIKATHGPLECGGSISLLQQKERRVNGGSPVQTSKETQISRCASVPLCIAQATVTSPKSPDRSDIRSPQGSPKQGVGATRGPGSPIVWYRSQVTSPRSVTTSARQADSASWRADSTPWTGSDAGQTLRLGQGPKLASEEALREPAERHIVKAPSDLHEHVPPAPVQANTQSTGRLPDRPDLRIKRWQEMEKFKASCADAKEQAVTDKLQSENLLFASADDLTVTMLGQTSPHVLSPSSSLQTIPPSADTILESSDDAQKMQKLQHGVPASCERRVEELCLTVKHHHDMHVEHANLFEMLRGEVNTLKQQVSNAFSIFEVHTPQLKDLAQELWWLKDSAALQKSDLELSMKTLRLEVEGKLGGQKSRVDSRTTEQDSKEDSRSKDTPNKQKIDVRKADGGFLAEDVQQLAQCVHELHLDHNSMIMEFDSEVKILKDMMERKILALQSALEEQLKEGRMIVQLKEDLDAECPQEKQGEQTSVQKGSPLEANCAPQLIRNSRARSWFSPRHEVKKIQPQQGRAASAGAFDAPVSSPRAEERLAVARAYPVSRQSSCPQHRSGPPTQVSRKTCSSIDEPLLRQRAQMIIQQQQSK